MEAHRLSDKTLLDQLDNLAGEEREILAAVIRCLREVQRRRLYSSLGHTSLFNFAVSRLRYSPDQAQRRIQAMKLANEVPEIEGDIVSGALTLTNIGLAHYHIKEEERALGRGIEITAKREVLALVTGKSKREAEIALARQSPHRAPVRPDCERIVSPDLAELRITAPIDTSERLRALKGALVAKYPDLSTGDLLQLLIGLGEREWLGSARPAPAQVKKRTALHRQVWERDKGRCTKCGSTYAVEVDHIEPKARGGPDSLANLRLLCRSCNQRAAIEAFGQHKMDEFIS